MNEQPKWSDDDIRNDALRASSNPTVQAQIRSCLLFMRHGYEAERDDLTQRLATLQAELKQERQRHAECTTSLITADRAIGRLHGEITLLRIENERLKAERDALKSLNDAAEAALQRNIADAKQDNVDLERMTELEAENERLKEDKEFWRKVAVEKERRLEQEVKRLKAELAGAKPGIVWQYSEVDIPAMEATIERLRAERWVPVEDGEHVVYEEVEGDGYYCRLSIVLSKQNGENVIELIDQGDMSMEMALPSGMKVCRWQPSLQDMGEPGQQSPAERSTDGYG